MVERSTRSGLAERRGRLVVAGDVALTNAGALGDRLVGCLQNALEIRVLHGAARKCGANPAHD